MARKSLNQGDEVRRKEDEQTARLIQERLTPLVEAVTLPDEGFRKAAVKSLLRTCVPAVLGLLVERLVGMVAQGGPAGQGPAVATLAQLGQRSVPALTSAFFRARSAATQQNLLTVLEKVGSRLALSDRVELMFELTILGNFVREETVRRDLVEVLAMLRRLNDAA
jgi:hypothetical protein